LALPKLPSPPRSTGNEELDRWALALFQYVKALAPAEDTGSDVPAELIDGSSSSLHYHAADRARANHTGTQAASTISDLSSFVLGLVSSLGANHSTLSGLAWTSSGHSGTASTLAGFDGSGAASVYSLGTGVATWLATPSSANLRSALTDETGTGAAYFQGGDIGTPSAGVLTNCTGLPVAGGGTGRATSTTAYGLLAAGTTATGAHQTLAAGLTTEILVGGGASSLPVWTAATGSGAPVRATSPTLVTPNIGAATGTSLALTDTDYRVANVTSSNGVGAFVRYTKTDGTDRTWMMGATGSGASIGDNGFALFDETAGAYRWVVDSAGNAGLSIAPVNHNGNARTLHIDSGANGAEIRLTNTATGSASGSGCLNSLIGSDYYLYNLENAFLSLGTNGTERVRIPAAGGLTLFSATAIGRDVDNSLLALRGGSTASDGGQLELYGNSHATIAGNFILSAVDGTGHSLQGTPAGTLTWSGVYYGPDGSASAPTYSFSSAGSANTGMYLSSTDELSFATNGTRRLLLSSAGLAVFKGGIVSDLGSGGGVGYTTGAGATVTQSTDKSTTVVLNTPVGEITMNSATLNANTAVSFTFTNASIGDTDLLLLNHSSAGTAGAYLLNAQCAAGSAAINVRNITAGNLGEAIVIRYALIKGATS
jgi:hypothetical protein